MQATDLAADDRLPLTCTRSGTCCHGKLIWVNPWEVAALAATAGTSPAAFAARHCTDGGIRLAMDGQPGWQGLPACTLFSRDTGCRLHTGRPLACRLYPLGRMRSGTRVRYVHEGATFPCLAGCPAVVDLPQLTVADYLTGQQVEAGEVAQDAYLELVQDLAEGAFVLLMDTGLIATRGDDVLHSWQSQAELPAAARAAGLPADWIGRLLLPEIDGSTGDPSAWIAAHRLHLQTAAQQTFAGLRNEDDLMAASALMAGLALHLAHSLGADVHGLAATWVATARTQR